MTIPKITPYSGGVANPDGSQTQTEFTQNMFDQLSYEAQLASELNATVNATNTTASEISSNAEIAQNSSDAAQAAANFEGDFTVGVTSAVKGKSYLYGGNVWLCLQNTTSTPSTGHAAWKLSVGEQYVTEAQEDLLPPGSSLFKGDDGVYLKNGDTVPAGTTHIRVLVGGKPTIVAMSHISDGAVSTLTEIGATIGVTEVTFIPLSNITSESVTAPLSALLTSAENSKVIRDSVTFATNNITTVKLPAGEFDLGDFSSGKSFMVEIPEGFTISGSGIDKTILNVSDVARSGVVFTNVGFDTEGEFDADGNITYEDFTINCGAPGSTSGGMCSIGTAHSKNLTVRRVKSTGNITHFLDISSGDGVLVENCILENNTNKGYGTSIIQVDGAVGLGYTGVLIDGTGSKNIKIRYNKITQNDNDMAIMLFHAATDYENIEIYKNKFTTGYTSTSVPAVGFEKKTGVTAKNIDISENTFTATGLNNKALNLSYGVDGSYLSDITIHKNKFIGNLGGCIYVGGTNTNTEVGTKVVMISKNIIDIDLDGITSSSLGCALTAGLCDDISIEGNIFKITKLDTRTQIQAVIVRDNYNASFSDNTLSMNEIVGSNTSSNLFYTTRYNNNLSGYDLKISENRFNAESTDYPAFISTGAIGNISFTKNDVFGESQSGYAFYDGIGASNLDNCERVVDLSSIGTVIGGGIVAISSSGYHTGIPIPVLKDSSAYDPAAKIELFFGSSGSSIRNNSESIIPTQVASGQMVGVHVRDITISGTFTIATGNAGVSMSINSSGAPSIRGSGHIKAIAYI